MYTLDDIKNWIFIDIETVSEAPDLPTLEKTNPAKAAMWRHRCEYLRRRYTECVSLNDDQLYLLKAGLHAEFAKVVCICLGIYQGDGKAQVIGFAGDDEAKVIRDAFSIVTKFKATVYNRSRTASAMVAGHNIKRFDVPFLNKRACINGIDLPDLLLVHNKKPWEMPFVDTAEIWSFGAWQESFTPLELLTNVLGLESSKNELHGSDVQSQYYNEHDIFGIKKYCQNDVLATMNVILNLSRLPIVLFADATRV